MIFQQLLPRGFDMRLLKGSWYNTCLAAGGHRGSNTPAFYTEGLKITKDGRISNPDNICICHKLSDEIISVRHRRSAMFYSVMFIPAD